MVQAAEVAEVVPDGYRDDGQGLRMVCSVDLKGGWADESSGQQHTEGECQQRSKLVTVCLVIHCSVALSLCFNHMDSQGSINVPLPSGGHQVG